MNAIKCELCGSNDIRKENGEYVCQFCHTKYTLEEAKKLMVEIEGTVKIDTTSKKDNYEKLAERAFNDQLYDQAYDYYNKLLELDSDNWKYIYKKGLCAAWQSTLANFRIDETIKSCKNAFNVIEVENIQLDNKDEICYEMASEINSVAVAFCSLSQKHYNEFWELDSAAPDYWNQLLQCISCEEYAALLIKDFIDKNEKHKKLYTTILKNLVIYYVEICTRRRYKTGYNQYGATYGYTWYKNELRAPIIEKYNKYVEELKNLDANYVAPTIEITSKAGCYVATCVYGSYDCPEVWTLRRYRDYYLNERKWGKIFIKIYYAVSPSIVKWFGKTKWFNTIFKKKLDKMVENLKAKGYKSTPYNDKF